MDVGQWTTFSQELVSHTNIFTLLVECLDSCQLINCQSVPFLLTDGLFILVCGNQFISICTCMLKPILKILYCSNVLVVTEVSKVPVLAGLHSSQNVGSMLNSLHTEAKSINIRTLHQFTSSGLESTELSESLEQLLCLSECYFDQIDY